jgi:hypothetical protein
VVTPVQWCGYTLALVGVSWYNYVRIIASKAQQPPAAGDASVKDDVKVKDKDDRRTRVDVEAGVGEEKLELLGAWKGSGPGGGEVPHSPASTQQRPQRQQ